MQFILCFVLLLVVRQCVSEIPCGPGDRITMETVFQTESGPLGAHWDTTAEVLYFIDSTNGALYRYDPSLNATTSVIVGPGLNKAIEVKDHANSLVVAVNLSVFLIEWNGESSEIQSSTVLFSVENDATQRHISSAAADANGVLYAGTAGNVSFDAQGREVVQPNLASLYQYRKQAGSCTTCAVLSSLSIFLDAAWSPDNTLMYFIDGLTRSIEVFDYDLESAELANRRTLFNISQHGFRDTDTHIVIPVSVAVDSDGNLWVPIYGVGILLHISSSGELISQYQLPTILLNSGVWGGEDLSTFYLTSNASLLKPSEAASQPEAGSVFAIKGLGARGINGGGYPVNVCCSVTS